MDGKPRHNDKGRKDWQEKEEPVELTPEQAAAQKKILEAKEKRQLSSKQVIDLATQNRENIARFKDVTNKIRLERTRRDELNGKTKELRAKRREMIDKIKAMRDEIKAELDRIRALPKGPTQESLKAEIEALEWSLSTEDRSPKEENALAKQIKELEKQLPFASKKIEMNSTLSLKKKELSEAIAPLDALDKELRPMVEEANAHHEKILAYYKEADQLSKSIRYTFTQLDMARSEADADRKAFEGELSSVRAKEREEREEYEKEQREQRQTHQEKVTAKAKEIFDAFKSGKKITREEIMILQQSGLM